MEKLPPTSYVRMVDISLIFAQLIPFVEVVLLTFLESFSGTEIVNHHGFQRNVVENQQVTKKRAKVTQTISFLNLYCVSDIFTTLYVNCISFVS